MHAIHFVEKIGRYEQVDSLRDEWESGYWTVTERTARRLVGGHIYLHPGQLKPATIGGVITGYRLEERNAKMRVVFTFTRDPALTGHVTSKQGWGNEQKRVFADRLG